MAEAVTVTESFDLRAIRTELAQIWDSGHEDDLPREKVRACAVNFVIPIEPDTFAGWQESLHELARLVPSRILLVERAPDGFVPPLQAAVHAACHRRKDGPTVCSEVVHIKSTAEQMPRVPSICRELAVSDLPVLLVSLVDAGLGGPAARALLDMADIVVLDSSAREDLSPDIYCDGDLTWPRLAAWRSAMANFLAAFDGFHVDQVERIEVIGRHSAPHLLAGWLALLLNGRLARVGEPPPRLRFSGGRAIDIAILPGPGRVAGMDAVKLRLGGLGSIEFHAADELRLRVEARVGDRVTCYESPARRLTFAEEVAHIVHSHGADEVYAKSRRLALGITPTGSS
jgi:hypothetical protein